MVLSGTDVLGRTSGAGASEGLSNTGGGVDSGGDALRVGSLGAGAWDHVVIGSGVGAWDQMLGGAAATGTSTAPQAAKVKTVALNNTVLSQTFGLPSIMPNRSSLRPH
ncbi:hypothetical protein GCM10025778_15470 [Paeniglutamicibacter antarcticus]|uniref:Hemolysin type calcium-binding protein n=1 Tax=Paeniglutamicibacter antarcticus TaxID=494023 RepID=A0ABP9TJM7_9MICC